MQNTCSNKKKVIDLFSPSPAGAFITMLKSDTAPGSLIMGQDEELADVRSFPSTIFWTWFEGFSLSIATTLEKCTEPRKTAGL